MVQGFLLGAATVIFLLVLWDAAVIVARRIRFRRDRYIVERKFTRRFGLKKYRGY